MISKKIGRYFMRLFSLLSLLSGRKPKCTIQSWELAPDLFSPNKFQTFESFCVHLGCPSWELLRSRKEKGARFGLQRSTFLQPCYACTTRLASSPEPKLLVCSNFVLNILPSGDLSVIEKPGISYSWRSINCGVKALKGDLI